VNCGHAQYTGTLYHYANTGAAYSTAYRAVSCTHYTPLGGWYVNSGTGAVNVPVKRKLHHATYSYPGSYNHGGHMVQVHIT
jgi:hypothetical protein